MCPKLYRGFTPEEILTIRMAAAFLIRNRVIPLSLLDLEKQKDERFAYFFKEIYIDHYCPQQRGFKHWPFAFDKFRDVCNAVSDYVSIRGITYKYPGRGCIWKPREQEFYYTGASLLGEGKKVMDRRLKEVGRSLIDYVS